MMKTTRRAISLKAVTAIVLSICCTGANLAGQQPSEARLISEVESIQSGKPFKIGVLVTLQDGWHTYWINPGDSGMAPRLTWKMPEGFSAGPVQWSAPQTFDEPPILTFGYKNQVLFFCEVQPPANLVAGQSYAIEARASWLICKEECLPKTATLKLSLPATEGTPVNAAGNEALFALAKSQIPVADPAWTYRAVADATAISLYVSPPENTPRGQMMKAVFFPAQPNLVEYNLPTWTRIGTEYVLQMKRAAGTTPLPDHMKGVLSVQPDAGAKPRAFEVDAALSQTEE